MSDYGKYDTLVFMIIKWLFRITCVVFIICHELLSIVTIYN